VHRLDRRAGLVDAQVSWAATLGTLAGGIGLFLLGMGMMTDGLKLAAGPALHRILGGATRTRWHALGSGVLVTALVQSSSAVTVAAIGFVNAGLLGLGPALWVLFGANVGTTMTGWVVALVGLKFKVEALALPLVGAGVVLKLTGEGRRRGALGSALAGFGLLFLGIALLQQAFTGLAGRVELPQGEGALAVLAQLAVGALMTVLMQSSSASMTIALTAAQGGLIDAQGAAAVVIGANVGTTVTALLASIGATANAKRAAMAHVVFNALTGVVALLLLPWLVTWLGSAREALELPPDPAAKLALFHTTFNVLGVLLMWPLAGALTRWLQQRFREREDDEAQPRFLDDTVLAVPTLALDALGREIARLRGQVQQLLRDVLAGAAREPTGRARARLAELDAAIEAFVERIHRSATSAGAGERLAALLRVLRYLDSSAEAAVAAAPFGAPAPGGDGVAQVHSAFVDAAMALVDATGHQASADGAAGALPPAEAMAAMETAYEKLKSELLAAGAAGRLPLATMEDALRRGSAVRRSLQQLAKAARHAASGAASQG
jgi:phosphate:Na+ symporter